MVLSEYHMKQLLEVEIEIVIESDSVFEVDCCARGYHCFKSFWKAPIGFVSVAKRESDLQSLIHDRDARGHR